MGQKQPPSSQTKSQASHQVRSSYLPLTVVMKTTDAVQAYYTARALYFCANLPFLELNKHSLTTKIDTHED